MPAQTAETGKISAVAGEANKLPVKRVVLYKNGVGYFEHLGRVREKQDVTIAFTSGQLNDVLKSLTVLDLGEGYVTGVTYESEAPIEKRLGELHMPTGEKTTLSEFLNGLRGALLEVRSGTTAITGRLLSIERKTRISGGTTLEVDYVALVTDTGEIRTLELTPAFSVRILDRSMAGTVSRYMTLLSSERDADLRHMVISTAGAGERPLFVSYISEVPVWKTTYRVVLPSKPDQKPLLQGWAIVDNTVGEDWENVQLSLVAGAPHSFVQQLSKPYYSRRPVVPLPEEMMTAPQTHEAALFVGSAHLAGTVTDPSGARVAGAKVSAFDEEGSLAGEAWTDAAGNYEFRSLPEGLMRVEVELPGFQRASMSNIPVSRSRGARANATLQVGGVAEAVEVTAPASSVNTSVASVRGRPRTLGSGRELGAKLAPPPPASREVPSGAAGGGTIFRSRLDQQRGRAQAAALAQEIGDLFEYKLKEPITIRKNQSSLVPILQAPVRCEKVSIWNESGGIPRPQRALWLTNSSGLTLDGGSFSVIEEETFAGEGTFEHIPPGEKRLVSYATDLALIASSRYDSENQKVTRVRVSHGIMTQQREVREKKTYTFRNEDSSPRTVIVEHPARAGYELRSEAKPVETSAAWLRFRVEVEPKQTASLVVEEARPQEVNYTISRINSDQVGFFVREQSINPAIEEALRKILAQKEAASQLEDQKDTKQMEKDKIFNDQERVRENMKSLKGSAEEKSLLRRYTEQLNTQEDRLQALRQEIQSLEEQQERIEAEIDKQIDQLSFDVKL